jgi:hypothetical protein
MYSFVNYLPDGGLQGLKHIGETLQNNRYLWLRVQLFVFKVVCK